jgi:3-hydroxyacyl-CoA dehydrogenase
VRELNLADLDAVETAAKSITVVDDIDELPASLPLVVECLPEDLDLKVRVLRSVAKHADEAVLASNTSSLSIAALGRGIGRPERTVGMHYWNPPLLMPLVEVTSGPDTRPAALDLVTRAVEAVGKVAVPVQRDVPGFIWNRLQMAVLREALWLLDNDVATIDAIDKVAQLGLARRWRQTGLFGSISLGGVSNWETVAANLFPQLSNATGADGLGEQLAAAGDRWSGLEALRDQGLAHDRHD